jgi:hypothetical protein
MKSVFKKVNFTILSEDTKQNIISFVIDHPELIEDFYFSSDKKIINPYYTDIQGTKIKSTGLRTMPVKKYLTDILKDDLKKLEESISIPFTAYIAYTNPNAKLGIHKDSRADKRQCGIMLPLYPDNNYAPTLIYPNCPSDKTAVKMTADDCPALWNIQEFHDVENNDNIRFNFQIYFGLPYTFDVVSKMIDNGTFFKIK